MSIVSYGTEKHFVYKLFLSLSISDFRLFLCKNCTPSPQKGYPLFPTNPLKIKVVSNPFLKIWYVFQPPPPPPSPPQPPAERGVRCGGVHTMEPHITKNNLQKTKITR